MHFSWWVEHTKCSGGWEISVQFIPFNFEHPVGPGAGNLNDYQSCGNLDILKTPSTNQIHHMQNYFSRRKILYDVLNVFADMQKVAATRPLVVAKNVLLWKGKGWNTVEFGETIKLNSMSDHFLTWWMLKYFNWCIIKV